MINEKLVRIYCKEDISKIKNYEKAIADTTQVWDCHHMTETWWNCSKKDLIENECYYNRKACELVFLTHAEHSRLHLKGKSSRHKGVKQSEETRRKIGEARKGKPSGHKGKTTSTFGKAFQEHYGITSCDDIKLYKKEYRFYKCYSKFSWEVK